MNVAKAAGFLLAVNFFAAGAVQAAPVYVDTFSGNECGGQGGFANCYATSNGTYTTGDTVILSATDTNGLVSQTTVTPN